ncbi:Octanoyltransferase [Thalassoporum mexicanum PCC 7367]|uniref:lipoyl(octanoyl) transferase LipB n=1 Tax=Thalassoporum mexicanum TaxID=3457544 RepID=UPI00029FA88A|nr:lipoyl(octanoyl) transferase LipB [Pseudanabaena sp. PCC 7367]AFY70115.1 Octanoyltransferase [Pseudanabaena sp. PCC 7367]
MATTKRTCYLIQTDRPIQYDRAWAIQKQLVEARKQNPDLPDLLWLLEHAPVYTLGQGSSLDFLKFKPGQSNHELHRTERGGEVTYHAPGQVVGYPILNLRRHKPDLHWYLRQLEQVMINMLDSFGLQAQRKQGLTGVWIGDRKIAQVGIKVSRWITMHGFAVNVNMDMAGFGQIVPCGISDYGCCSMAELGVEATIETVKTAIAASFAQSFEVELISKPLPKLVELANI